ncbi:MAG: TonB-dependent receptor domain-containing protein, partial [Parvibaculales bacterium]
KDNFKFFANFKYDLEGHELYGFGNVSSRTSTGPFYFRNPHTRGGVFTKDGGKNVLVADLSSDGESGGCPAVPIVNHVPDATALAQVASNPNCFAFIQRFPGGFAPQFSGEVEEYSFALGLKGLFNFPFLGEWEYDLSAVWGTHQTDFFISNTVNPQLVARQLDVPTRYNPGAYSETDLTINADFLRLVEMPFFRNPVNLSWGVEYRQEEFDIIAGGENSWFVDPNIAKQGFAVGSNGFPGFNLRDAGASKRGAWSVYIDSEVKLSEKTEMGLALRHEKYEDFDDALDGKLALRYEVNENVLLRASFNSGVRIPTVGQANVRNVTTEFVLGKLLDQATLPSTHPISVQKGGKPLKAERSENLSFGVVVRQGRARLSMDYYDFNVQGRIALTSPLELTDADKAQLLAEGFADSSSFSQVRYFTNDFDTRTKGIDITYKVPLGRGNKTNFSLTANWIDTKVTKRNKAIVDDVRVQRLEALHPKLRYSAAITHEGNEWGALVRMRYYGPASEDYLENINLTVESSNHYLFDVEMTRKLPSLGNISLGVRNLLNKRPDRNPYSGIAGSLYPEYGPFGNGGAFYYIRIQRKMF